MQGFKTCKTLTQQLKRAIAEATLFIIAEEILSPFGSFRESIYKLTDCQMILSTFLEKVNFWFLPSSPQTAPTPELLLQFFSNKNLFTELAKLIIAYPAAEQCKELHHVFTDLIHTNKHYNPIIHSLENYTPNSLCRLSWKGVCTIDGVEGRAFRGRRTFLSWVLLGSWPPSDTSQAACVSLQKVAMTLPSN